MTQTAKLTASDALPDDGFGDSVSISGNTVVVGGSDAAYVFTEPDAGWANMTQTAELTVSPGSPGYSYSPVAISGDTIVVGATYVFSEPPTGWTNMTQTAELTPPAVSACVGQRHEYDHAAGGVTRRRYDDDRTIAIHVVAFRKSEVRAPFEPILFISYAGKRFAELSAPALPDELALLRRHPYGHIWKVGQAADVVPMRMGQKNSAQRSLVVAGSL